MKIKPGVRSKSGPGAAQSPSDRLPALGSALDLFPSGDGSGSCEAERCSGSRDVCECRGGAGV